MLESSPDRGAHSRRICARSHANGYMLSCAEHGHHGFSEQEGPRTRAQKIYKENDPVVARYTRKSLWYAATVMNVRNDGMIKIKWLDGDKVSSAWSLLSCLSPRLSDARVNGDVFSTLFLERSNLH